MNAHRFRLAVLIPLEYSTAAVVVDFNQLPEPTVVDNVLQFAIYAAYAGRLETAFLTDEVGSANAVLRSPAQSPASPKSPLAPAPQADAVVASAAPQPAAKV